MLQSEDDSLIAGETEEIVKNGTIDLLNFLGDKGLKVSKSKLQFAEQEVEYLGHWNSEGKKKLDPDRVSEILALPAPSTKWEIRMLLGLLGYCRQWIEGYSEKVKFLYEQLTQNSLRWTMMDKEQFQK